MTLFKKILILTVSIPLILMFISGIILVLAVLEQFEPLQFLTIKGIGILAIYISYTILYKIDVIELLSKY